MKEIEICGNYVYVGKEVVLKAPSEEQAERIVLELLKEALK